MKNTLLKSLEIDLKFQKKEYLKDLFFKDKNFKV